MKKRREKWLYAYYLWLFASVAIFVHILFHGFFSSTLLGRIYVFECVCVYFITAQTDLKATCSVHKFNFVDF